MGHQPTIFYILENETLGTWWVGKMESTLDGCGICPYRSISQCDLIEKLTEKYYCYMNPYITLITLNKNWNACYGVERWLSKLEYKIKKETERYKELEELLKAGWDGKMETSTLSVLHVLEPNQPIDQIFRKLVTSREGLTRCLNKAQFQTKSRPELARNKVLMDMKKKQKLPKPSTLQKYNIKDHEIEECMGPKGIIYKIDCEVSGKSYIGKTIQPLKKRIRQHQDCNSYCRALSQAIQDHGWENFKFSAIWEGNVSLLGEMERKLISEHGTMEPGGYNLREGGGRSERVSDTSRTLMIEKQREISKRRGGLLGVLIPNGHGKVTSWSISIPKNGKRHRVGPFKTKEEAIEIQKKITENPDEFELPEPKRVGNGKGSGIYYTRNKWQVLPRVNGKNVYLGHYKTEEEAREALTKFREKDTILE